MTRTNTTYTEKTDKESAVVEKTSGREGNSGEEHQEKKEQESGSEGA